jgi:hypothetical protein
MMPEPLSTEWWNETAGGKRPEPLPPPTLGDKVFWIVVIICLIAGFMWWTRDRSEIDLSPYIPAYQSATAPETPQNAPESPQSDFPGRPAIIPVFIPEVGSEDGSEAQSILDEIESVGMPACGEPISIAGADDIESSYC